MLTKSNMDVRMSQLWYSRIAVSVSERSDLRVGTNGTSGILGTLGILGKHIRKTLQSWSSLGSELQPFARLENFGLILHIFALHWWDAITL